LGRILAIDYGRKRTGLAVTDPLKIIATGLTTVPSHTIWDFLKKYVQTENVERIIVGYPLQMNGNASEAVTYINPFIKKLVATYPSIPIETADERFTSKMAHQAMVDGGLKKKDLRNKELIDTVSATIILQWYMEKRKIF